MMIYVLLAVLIAINIAACTILTMSEGFTKPLPSAVGMALFLIDYVVLSKIIVHMNAGVAYAILCGVGIVATSIISAIFFKQKLTPIGIASAAMICGGVVFMHLFGTV